MTRTSRTHGIYSLRDSGPKTLDPVQIERYSELKQLVKTHPGRIELREELAARAALLVDLGFSELIKTASDGQSVWDSPVIRRMGTYMAELRRILDSFPANDNQQSANEIIQELMANDG